MNLTLLVSSFIFIFIIIIFIERKIQRYFLVNKYKTIIDFFDHFLKQSYNLIYNDQIIAFTSNAQKIIPKDEMETIERNFIKLTLELMGEKNQKMFTAFFGNRRTLINHMILYMRKELEQDSLADFLQNQEHFKNSKKENKV